MSRKSLLTDAKEVQLAIDLIRHGARLQLLEQETSLSRERLIRLYKEIKGMSPPKGMLPFSTDWFVTWQPNIHSSLFINIYKYLCEHANMSGIAAILKAYRLYLEQLPVRPGEEPVLSLTRAWRLIRFFESNMLQTAPCTKCGGHFVTHTYDLHDQFVCGLCNLPSRAGKTKKAAEEKKAA
ncbi:flagellar transcriptional regulator FlhC [Oxalobacter vibrioformis]|uniref:Flagellar transcriptional regulator FlhC n=1 Tax=Oxalobacter vibrioformis TaxID=933080 RepID=A0A9E9LXX7_9BURK|nr:flagellar transcriptional regulator FlhC [Oxalobacter vibrioformis]WAW09502.1 flagellar transcriptional regulator FlhC [Oxalobacter vibrioformis]